MLRQILVSINMLELTFFRNTGLGLSKSKALFINFCEIIKFLKT